MRGSIQDLHEIQIRKPKDKAVLYRLGYVLTIYRTDRSIRFQGKNGATYETPVAVQNAWLIEERRNLIL